MAKMAGCYKITNKVNGKIYIGMSTNLEKRRFDHFKKSQKAVRKLYNAFEKYGKENFVYEVIYIQLNGTLENLAHAEQQLIREFNSVRDGYNILPASRGRGAYGPEWSEKMRLYYQSEAARQKCAQPGEQNPMYGRSRRGEKLGGAVTPMLGEKNPMFGRDWRQSKSKEELDAHRMRSTRYGEANGCFRSHFKWIHKNGEQRRHPVDAQVPEGWVLGFAKVSQMQEARRRKVRCITTGQTYESLTAASIDTGCDIGKISMCCTGKRKSTNQLKWEYVWDQ
jgi:group I intron endonuclease